MSLRVWPTAMALEPDSAERPSELRALLSQVGAVTPVVLLVAGPAARATGWAARAAVALADDWAQGGRRVVLADLSIGDAELDSVLSIVGDEGAVDLFLFGASLTHLLRRPDGHAFEYLPAGVAPAAATEVLGHPRWRQLIADAFRTGTSLLVYTPASVPGLTGLAGRIASTIVLAPPGDTDAVDAVLPEDAAILAVLAPKSAVAEGDTADTAAAEPLAAAGAELASSAEEAERATAQDGVAVAGDAARTEDVGVTAAATRVDEEIGAEDADRGAESRRPIEALAAEQAFDAAAAAGVADATGAADVIDVEAPTEAEAATDAENAAGAEEATEAASVAEAEPAIESEERVEARAAVGVEPSPVRGSAGEPAVGGEPSGAGGVVEAVALEPAVRAAGEAAAEAARGEAADAVVAHPDATPGAEPSSPPAGDRVPDPAATGAPPLLKPRLALHQRPPARRRARLTAALLVGTAAIVGILFAVRWYVSRPEPAAAPAPPAVTPLPPPEPRTDSLPYSVAIAAYPEYVRAAQRTAELAAEQPDMTFFISPVLVAGTLRYQVLAGPVADSAGAAILMRRLLDAGIKTGASAFDIRSTRLAFALGEFEAREDALARSRQLATKKIPTYVVEVPYTSGPPHYRVYAGAFAGAAEADVMRPLLRGAGVPDSLVLRVGRSTQ
ncbi:MAG: SPOR domain-containing protein [Gemmatimonadetes bacterium]|nr:SPOR domain-containing protein [Gemmatimonadota bacterium]